MSLLDTRVKKEMVNCFGVQILRPKLKRGGDGTLTFSTEGAHQVLDLDKMEQNHDMNKPLCILWLRLHLPLSLFNFC